MSPVNESSGSAQAGGRPPTEGSDTYVDLTYRGLPLGNRVKLTEVQPEAGFLHLVDPMPVGTAIMVVAGDGPVFEVTVVEVREHKSPGMVVKPMFDAASRAWWSNRVRPSEGMGSYEPMVVRPTRTSFDSDIVDDGRVTEVMETALPLPVDLDAPGKAGDKSRDRGRRKRKHR